MATILFGEPGFWDGVADGVRADEMTDVGCDTGHDMPDPDGYCIECGYPWDPMPGTPANPSDGETTRL